MNNIFGAATFKPETTFENTFGEIKYNHLKGIAASAMNLSTITLFDNNLELLTTNKRFEAEKF